MPDASKQTISASEIAALFGASPYVTPWLLWQRFARGVDIDQAADSRMTWGTKLEPLILEQAAADLRFEVRPNRDESGGQRYFRRGLLGCHRDGDIICPDRGPGAIEAKSIFEYGVWMDKWKGGDAPPRHIEMQIQIQMAVGDGVTPYQWGIIPAWVCGEVHYFEREPIPEFWRKAETAAAAFFASVKADQEPDPFGVPIETPWYASLFPTVTGKVLDLSGDDSAAAHADAARAYVAAKEGENAGKRIAEPLRAKLLALARDNQEVWLPGAIRVRIGGNEKSKRLSVYIPEVSQASPNYLMAG